MLLSPAASTVMAWPFLKSQLCTKLQQARAQLNQANLDLAEKMAHETEKMGVVSRWVFFNIFVLVAVALDLGVFNRRPHKISMREAAISSVAFIAFAGIFGAGVLWFQGRQPAMEFFTGYLIEKALSIDKGLFLRTN